MHEEIKSVDDVLSLVKDEEIINQIKNLDVIDNDLTIALVMLVKNQESIIQEVLEKIKLLDIDELHIIDTGSTDSTVAVLQKIDDVMIHHLEWVEDYALMRNVAATYTNADWILTMDSDELMLSEGVILKPLINSLSQLYGSSFSISFEVYSENSASYSVPAKIYSPRTARYFGMVHEELRAIETDQSIMSILTRIKIENKGTTDEEVAKFSKEMRYSKLSFKMMAQEPDNPRWFVLMPLTGVQKLVDAGQYEQFLNQHLFENRQFDLVEENIKHHSYTKMLFEKYAAHLIAQNQIDDAVSLIGLGLKFYSEDIYLQFYLTISNISQLKYAQEKLLKENLERYLSLDKQRSYDYNFSDSQLLEVAIAELNFLNGNQTFAEKIVSQLTDKRVLNFWDAWHPKL